MTLKLFLILLFQLGDTPEQVALDYFMTNIFPTEFAPKTRLKFKGDTEKSGTYFNIVSPCFKDYDSDKEINFELYGRKTDNAGTLKLDILTWKKNFKKVGTTEMKIYRATKVRDKYYVDVTINYSDRTDSYFIELTDKFDVIRFCKTGLIY